MAANVTNILGFAGEIANLFGLNNWQLQEASYNGIQFMVFGNNFFENNNPFQGVTYSGILGPATPPDNGTNALPFGTKAAVGNVQDRIDRRLVIHDIPNRDGNFIENLGFTGETYTMIGLLAGPQYYDRFSTIRVGFTADPQSTNSQTNILVHPLYGTIPKAYLKSWQLVHSSDKWRAVAVMFEFVCDNRPGPILESTNITSQIFASISLIENMVILLAEVLNLGSALFSRLNALTTSPQFGSSLGDPRSLNPVIRTQAQELSEGNQNLSQLFLFSSAILWQYLKPEGATDFYLSNVQVNLALLPSLFRYVTIFGEKEADILVSYYAHQAEALIEQYRAFGLATVFVEQIYNIRQSVVILDQFAKLLLNANENSYTSYTVPNTMSLREAIWRNGLNLNTDYISTMLLNRDVLGTTNKIVAGTVLKFRKIL